MFALALLAVAGSLRRQDAGAQSIEEHSGTFSYVRVQNDLMATACAFSGFSVASGTLQFRLDHTTNEIAGSLEGAGAIGYQDGDWQSQPNRDPLSWTTAFCHSFRQIQSNVPGPDEIAFMFHGTIKASFLGTYDPVSGQIMLDGDATLAWTVRYIGCLKANESPVPAPTRSMPCAGSHLVGSGAPTEDAIRNKTDFSFAKTDHVTLTGRRFSSSASGSIALPDASITFSPIVEGGEDITACCITTNGTWSTTFETPAATPSPTPTPSPTAAPAVAGSGPGAPPTVCSDCSDEDWAAQQAALWAWGAQQSGVVFQSGGRGVPATADQIAASQEQLRRCIVAGLATERQKPAAQQRSRLQVYADCKTTLPVQIPFG